MFQLESCRYRQCDNFGFGHCSIWDRLKILYSKIREIQREFSLDKWFQIENVINHKVVYSSLRCTTLVLLFLHLRLFIKIWISNMRTSNWISDHRLFQIKIYLLQCFGSFRELLQLYSLLNFLLSWTVNIQQIVNTPEQMCRCYFIMLYACLNPLYIYSHCNLKFIQGTILRLHKYLCFRVDITIFELTKFDQMHSNTYLLLFYGGADT
jgi:hypothetical protein